MSLDSQLISLVEAAIMAEGNNEFGRLQTILRKEVIFILPKAFKKI